MEYVSVYLRSPPGRWGARGHRTPAVTKTKYKKVIVVFNQTHKKHNCNLFFYVQAIKYQVNRCLGCYGCCIYNTLSFTIKAAYRQSSITDSSHSLHV